MNTQSSYCGLVDAKIRASDKDLPVCLPVCLSATFDLFEALCGHFAKLSSEKKETPRDSIGGLGFCRGDIEFKYISKSSTNMLKYPTFEEFEFLFFHGDNQCKMDFLHKILKT